MVIYSQTSWRSEGPGPGPLAHSLDSESFDSSDRSFAGHASRDRGKSLEGLKLRLCDKDPEGIGIQDIACSAWKLQPLFHSPSKDRRKLWDAVLVSSEYHAVALGEVEYTITNA